MTTEPQHDPLAETVHVAPNVWGPAPDAADPNAPADPWVEDRAAIRRAIAIVLRAAREHGCLREDSQ